MFQIELVREMTYPRTQSTEDTIPKGGILYMFSDASSEMNQFVAYLSLPRKNGMWTCQFMSGKNHLAKKTASIPNKELDAAATSTAPACELDKSLGELVAKKVLIVDSINVCSWIKAGSNGTSQTAYITRRVIMIKETFGDECY